VKILDVNIVNGAGWSLISPSPSFYLVTTRLSHGMELADGMTR
jgi:hypothetical protein